MNNVFCIVEWDCGLTLSLLQILGPLWFGKVIFANVAMMSLSSSWKIKFELNWINQWFFYLYTHWKLKLPQWVNSCRTAGAENRGKSTELCSFFEDLHSTHLCWSTLWWQQIWWACTDTKAEIGLVFATLISMLPYEIENYPLLSAVLLLEG